MTIIDTHCHVHDDKIPGGTDIAIATAVAGGVTTMITVGCDRATSIAAMKVAADHPEVYATIGLHPHDAKSGIASIADLFDANPDELPGLDRVVAVGEAGLDYYYEHSPRDVQRAVFAEQIAIAHDRDLPLIIHTREAWDDTFDVLRSEGTPERTVFHCFTGGPDEARRCLDIGAYVSFSGIVTFKSATELQAAAELVPLDRLLVETDSPYLAPVPHRGKPNQPAWVVDVVGFIADRRDLSAESLADATTDAARRAFPRLGAPADSTAAVEA